MVPLGTSSRSVFLKPKSFLGILRKENWAIGSLVFCCTSCGLNLGVSLGGSGTPNDPRPSGNPVAQGSFSGSVSGSALVFQSGGGYVLRFEGLSVPSAAGLIVNLYNSSSPFVFNLTALTGNQNYNVNAAMGSTQFSSVTISSTVTGTVYGTAPLLGTH